MTHRTQRITHPWGAIQEREEEWSWRVWAPNARKVEVCLYETPADDLQSARVVNLDLKPTRKAELSRSDQGFQIGLSHVREGQLYGFSLNGNPPRPDPASRWQPGGVHGPSALFNPEKFAWSDGDWGGVERKELVIYELHVGTFSLQGTFAAIIPRLPGLAELGITAIELMPVNQFPGSRDWGYDGTYWHAVQNSYGGPRELQKLVDACHFHGIGVILDVVYNHLGPEGNYWPEYGPCFSQHHLTPWGGGLNFDGPNSEGIRSAVLQNVAYWLRDFHLDGLRIDAVHAIRDESEPHILTEISRVAQSTSAKRGWPAHIIAESNLNDSRILDSVESGGYSVDAQWNDDFHHVVHVLLTNELDGYYADFDQPRTQLAKSLNDNFILDGCHSRFRGRPHGNSARHLTGDRFVVSIQTHDQIGNRPRGDRLHSLVKPEQQRLAACLMLLSPNLPMLFMGEEYGETCPFPFFCDFQDPLLQESVRQGRKLEFADSDWSEGLWDPLSPETFEAAKLHWTWASDSPQAGLRRLYTELLAARRRFIPLHDFSNRAAVLTSDQQEEQILILRRGDPMRPEFQAVILFNLSETYAATLGPTHVTHRLLLRSEDSRFGGNHPDLSDDGSLLPYECMVYVPRVTPTDSDPVDEQQRGK